jgi:hypothetical protein
MQKAKAYAVEGLEEGGDDPKTATDVVHALYAKYKKNVSARRRHASRDARTQTTRTPPTRRKNPTRKESATFGVNTPWANKTLKSFLRARPWPRAFAPLSPSLSDPR